MTNDIFKTAYGKRALMSSKKTLIFLAVVFGIIQWKERFLKHFVSKV